ncbi:MAG: glutamate-5-semialdehyde dehydrogenase [Clostridia bacterium]
MLTKIGQNAKKSQTTLMCATTKQKNEALELIASELVANTAYIISENEKDVDLGRQNGMSESLIDRLSLDEGRISRIASAVREIIMLDDPVGKVLSGSKRPNGLVIEKVSVPLGVVAVIFEARPNVTADAAALCLKAGNCVILRGGKEAFNSNMAITKTMRNALEKSSLPVDCVQLISDTSRESATALMKLNKYVDVLIPRGGAGLIKACVENSSVPVIETGTGNCHVYVEKTADFDMTLEIIHNAKTSRPSVCNACESVLIDEAIAAEFLPLLKAKLDTKNVVIHGCEQTKAILSDVLLATDEDYYKEYLDYEISIKVVSSTEDAINHIMTYTSGHSECIVTSSYDKSRKFTSMVDAAAVYVNASTRFTDGGEFGFGAEIGISTQKLHARGPLGLAQLNSCKFVVYGDGQIR